MFSTNDCSRLPLLILVFTVWAFSTPLEAKSPVVKVATLWPEYEKFLICGMREAKKELGGDFKFEWLEHYAAEDVNALYRESKKIIQEKPLFVVGAFRSQDSLLVSKLFNDAKLPMITPVSSHPDVTLGKPYVYRFHNDARRNSRLYYKFIKEDLKPKKMMILCNLSTSYSTFYADQMEKHFARDDSKTKLVRQCFVEGKLDSEAIAKVVKQEKIDHVYAPIYTLALVRLAEALNQNKLSVDILTHSSLDLIASYGMTESEILATQRIFYNGLYKDLEGPHKKLAEKILSRCPQDLDSASGAMGVDLVLLAKSLADAGVTSSEDVGKYLRSHQIDSLLGPVRFDDQGNVQRPLHLRLLKKGGAVFYKTVDDADKLD